MANRHNRHYNQHNGRIEQRNSSETMVKTREESDVMEEISTAMTETPSIFRDTPDLDIATDTEVATSTETIPGIELLTPLRLLDDIKNDFQNWHRKGLESAYKMGELLNEAKAQLTEHGEWLEWLRAVNFPERQAQRLMLLAKGYSDTTTLSYLGQSKALALLKVDEEERDEFIKEPHMITLKGVLMPTSVRDMSVRQLEGVIQEHMDKYKKKAPKISSPTPLSISHNDAIEVSVPMSDFDSKFEHLQLCIDSLWEHIESLTENPNKRLELTDKLRHLYQEALQRSQERKDR